MRLLILILFVFSSTPAFAYWHDRISKTGHSDLSDGSFEEAKADALHSLLWYVSTAAVSNPPPYYYVLNKTGTTNTTYFANYTLYTWKGSEPPPARSPEGDTVYNLVYTDEQCQALFGGEYNMQGYDISQDTINLGACKITQSGVTVGGGGGTYSDWVATSTGEVNQPPTGEGNGEPSKDTDFSPADYLTPVSECNNYNCVTIDGQLYQVDQDAIPDNGSIDISQDADTIQFYKGGGYKLTHPDGSYEIMDGQGNTTYHNADGSIDPNGGSDSGSDGGSDSGGDSGSDGGDSGSDGGGDSSGGGTTPGTGDGDSDGSDDGEGDSGDGDGDSTLGDVVGAIYNLRDSLTGSLQDGLDGVVDKLTGTDGMPSEADAIAMVDGEGASDEVMETLQGQYDETNEGLVENYEGVFKDDGGILGQALSSVGEMATSLLPSVPTGGCSPLVFGDGDTSFTISCEVFDMIKAALSWILFFFTVYEVTSIGLGYRNNA